MIDARVHYGAIALRALRFIMTHSLYNIVGRSEVVDRREIAMIIDGFNDAPKRTP